MKKDLEIETKKLRAKGYSIKELHKMMGVSKDTISRWVKGIVLSDEAQARINQNYTNGQLASMKTIREKTHKKDLISIDFAKGVVSKADTTKPNQSVLCSMLYFCEGNKSVKSLVSFTNSDPSLIATFLYLFRNSFSLDESKFRVLMHLHPYHDEKTQMSFWSKITGIPKNQFNKTYQKPTKGQYKKEGYQGCIKIRYNDVSVARNLHAIAKMFMERYK